MSKEAELSKDNVDPVTGMKMTPNDEGFNPKVADAEEKKIAKARAKG